MICGSGNFEQFLHNEYISFECHQNRFVKEIQMNWEEELNLFIKWLLKPITIAPLSVELIFLIFTVFLFFNNFRPFIILNFDWADLSYTI